VSLQFSILKVLAGQPEGRAAVVDLNRYITVLSGPEWTARMKRLSARAPSLDIFSLKFVLRDDTGWQLTDAGRAFLAGIEMPAPVTFDQRIASPDVVVSVLVSVQARPRPTLRLVVDNQRGRPREKIVAMDRESPSFAFPRA
jgi:hypothetical protein